MKGIALQPPGGAPASGLPRDLEEAAASRLAFVASVGIAVATIAAVASLFRVDAVGARAGMDRPLWMAPLGAAVSLLMLLAARSRRLDVATKITVGIGYLIAMCAGTAVFRHSLRYLPEDILRGFSPGS